jgi:hypothetical protein
MTSSDPTILKCSLCNKPVDLNTAKTNEAGQAVHEECYVLIQAFNQATQRAQQPQTLRQGSGRSSPSAS